MNNQKFYLLSGVAALALAAGILLTVQRDRAQEETGAALMFPDLKAALNEVAEIRISKGDGSRVTLRKSAANWLVDERQYPADPTRVRELVMALVNMKKIETKTRDPANYARLGVEAPESPTAASTLVTLNAGAKSWSLIVGKSAEGRAVYVRRPADADSALAQPNLVVDPDQKRWIDRQLTDVAGAVVHEVSVKPASGPAYLLTRAAPGAADLELSPVPKGRKPVNPMTLSAQADALTGFNFDDVRGLPATAPAPAALATYRLFDGQVLEFAGRRDGDKAFVSVKVSRDAALAARYPKAEGKAAAKPDAKPNPAEQTVERLTARVQGVEFEIPLYKYDALFKPQEELLEKR